MQQTAQSAICNDEFFFTFGEKTGILFRDFPLGNTVGEYLMGRAHRARQGGWGAEAPRSYT
jgi:hypothetical protein